jgi:hypothetical protein
MSTPASPMKQQNASSVQQSSRSMLKEITTRSSMASDMLIDKLHSTANNFDSSSTKNPKSQLQQQSTASSASFPSLPGAAAGGGPSSISPKNDSSSHHHHTHHGVTSKSFGANNTSGNSAMNPSSVSIHDAVTAGGGADALTPKTKNLFKKNIVGDLFGTSYGDHSLLGFMYRSRIIEKTDNKIGKAQEKKEENLQVDSITTSNEIIESESDSDNDAKMLKNMNPKQQLAMTIKNWSVFPENDEHIIKEGAVYALIALAHMDDSTIRKCCASSFYHLSSREKNRDELLSIGTTAGVITLAMQARNW